jgi:hypothetical protein
MERSEYDFDVITGPSRPPRQPAPRPAPAEPQGDKPRDAR